MNCPKCGHELTSCQDIAFAYCPKKEIVVKFGEPYDRKFRITPDPDSGCGTLFCVPTPEKYWIEKWDRKYRPGVARTNKAIEHGGAQKASQSRTAYANG